MKLLIDENISYRILSLISPPFDFSPPLRSDEEIWKKAQSEGLVILTFDEDFSEWQLLRTNPPKVIWLRMGNTPTRKLAKILKENAIKINRFGDEPESLLLGIN